MRYPISAIVLMTLLAGAPCVHAQSLTDKDKGGMHYRWRDAHGQLHYSDSLTQEAMAGGYDVVNNQGLVTQHVARQLSPDELAAARKATEQKAAEQKAAQAQAQDDEQMLAAYPTEAQLKAAQQEALGTYDQHIATVRINLRSQEQALSDLLARAAQNEHAKQPVPKSLSDAIQQQRGVVAAQQANLARQQGERDQAVAQNAAQLRRYEAIKAQRQGGGAGSP